MEYTTKKVEKNKKLCYLKLWMFYWNIVTLYWKIILFLNILLSLVNKILQIVHYLISLKVHNIEIISCPNRLESTIIFETRIVWKSAKWKGHAIRKSITVPITVAKYRACAISISKKTHLMVHSRCNTLFHAYRNHFSLQKHVKNLVANIVIY